VGRPLALIALLASTASADPDRTGTLAGTVLDEDTGQPLAGVIVTVTSSPLPDALVSPRPPPEPAQTLVTGADGTWSVPVSSTRGHDLAYASDLTSIKHESVWVLPRTTEHYVQQFGARHSSAQAVPLEIDTRSFDRIRAQLARGERPAPGDARIDELVNYVPYSLPGARYLDTLAVTTEVGPTPWNPATKLVRVVLHTRPIADFGTPARNVAIVIDTASPLVVPALGRLVDALRESDTISVITAAGFMVPPTRGDHRAELRQALATLEAGGPVDDTARLLARTLIREHFWTGGTNALIVISDTESLDVLGNVYDDSRIEENSIAVGESLDGLRQEIVDAASDFFVQDYTVAHDVKLEVTPNPARARSIRRLGSTPAANSGEQYEGADLSFGHSVTALFEVEPTADGWQAASSELLTVKARFNAGQHGQARVLRHSVTDRDVFLDDTTVDFHLAAALAGFGMLLGNESAPELDWDLVASLARAGIGSDRDGLRTPVLEMIQEAAWLAPSP
jgi:Ca-activated chloride channel family protein